jgi:putative thiamine transport system substrate-binding protein
MTVKPSVNETPNDRPRARRAARAVGAGGPIRRPALGGFLVAALLLLVGLGQTASAQSASVPPPGAEDPVWQATLDRARGQTVYFNAWGGSDRINRYLEWAAAELDDRFWVTLIHVRVTDIAEVVARLRAEAVAGRAADGSVDLLWVNGENFATLKESDLLGPPFAESLPHWAFVDPEEKPTLTVDFGVPTDGLESPWGMAQLVFFYDSAWTDPPADMDGLLEWAAANPGRFTYPRPPDFLGTTFLKQVLVTQVADPARLADPAGDDFQAVTAPVWAYLDRLTPHLWRAGRSYPANGPALMRLLGDGEIAIGFAFNPAEASAGILAGQLPDTIRPFLPAEGTLGNTHFLAIPAAAQARAAALVTATFLLSPQAQLRKEDPGIWGDPTVLSMDRLPDAWRARFADLDRGPATPGPDALAPSLPEPHPSWTAALEAAWVERYQGR